MSNATKIWLIIASSFVFLGLVTVTVVMALCHWDFSLLSTAKYEQVSHEITDGFENISIDASTADVVFLSSDDDTCQIICYQNEHTKYSVNVVGDTLTITESDERKWHDYVGITFGSPNITVYLPKTKYATLSISGSTGDISIPKDFNFENLDISLSTGDITSYAFVSKQIKLKGTTGNVHLENINAKEIDVSLSTGNVYVKNSVFTDNVEIRVSTGNVTLSDISCKNLTSHGNTGKITLDSVIASAKISIERSTGDVTFNRCDAGEIFVLTDTGDVEGSLLSEKIFFVLTDTGKKEIPNTFSGGKCEIKSDTGDVKIRID